MDRSKNGAPVPRVTQQLLAYAHAPIGRVGSVRRVALSGGTLDYRLVRARRRTIGLLVHRGEVEARAPGHVTIAEVEEFIRAKESWIARCLAKTVPEPPPLRLSEGMAIPLLGRAVRLTALAEAGPVRLMGDRLMLPPGDFAHWRTLTLTWLHATALNLFHDRVRHFAPKLGVREPSLGLSNARTQWGSCWRTRGEFGRVLLNWRLIHLPAHLPDYVVAHELAHLREPNHSARFWAIVARLFPDYVAARRELNRLGAALPLL